MKRANGSFGSRNGQPWAAHMAQARRRSVDARDSTQAGTSSPEALLAPDKIRGFLAAFLCPWCGAGPFKVVAAHVSSSHGIGRVELRDAAGLSRGAKLTPKDYSENLARIHGERLAEISASGRAATREKYGDTLYRLGNDGRIKRMKAEREALAGQAISLMGADLTLAEIAAEMSISIPRLRTILDENGVDDDLRGRGAKLRGTPEAANQWLRDNWELTEARLREGGERYYREEREKFIAMYNETDHDEAGLDRMAEEYGISRRSVLDRLKKYGCDRPDLRGNSAASLAASAKRRGRPDCTIDGCTKPNAARGMCDMHYRRWKKHN